MLLWTLAVIAETTMNAISVMLGSIIQRVVPISFVAWVMTLMFLFYGLKLIWEGRPSCWDPDQRDDSTIFSEMSEAEEAI